MCCCFFVLGVAAFVAVVFPEVLVIVAVIASVFWLLVAVSGEGVVHVPIKLFHINIVLSLSTFFSLLLARFKSHSYVVILVPCWLSLDCLLSLSLSFPCLLLLMLLLNVLLLLLLCLFCCSMVLVCLSYVVSV